VDSLITAARKPPHQEDLHSYSTGTESGVKPRVAGSRDEDAPQKETRKKQALPS
jgi:hypothetical protein